MASLSLSVNTPSGRVDVPTDILAFSAARCFAHAKSNGTESALYQRLAEVILAEPAGVALYGRDEFIKALLNHNPSLAQKLGGIVDKKAEPGKYGAVPLFKDWQGLPGEIGAVFLCCVGTELRWRLRREMEGRFKVLCPDVLAGKPELLPPEAWTVVGNSNYPLPLPGLDVAPDLDVLLLPLPARNNFAMPLTIGYVNKAFKRIPGLKFQTLDADTIFYHRYHIRRLFDIGETLTLKSGRALELDPWHWTEECWMDPQHWEDLYALFEDDIRELVGNVVKARPKILALSIHQRNEWIGRHVVRLVKAALPDIQILAGGHSCVSPEFGPRAFPEFDYMVVGESEAVLEPLVQGILSGTAPKDMPGIISRNDTPGRAFVPAQPPENLDEIGGPDYDWIRDWKLLYTFQNEIFPYVYLTRGCIWARCAFCSERFQFRTRSAKPFVDELEELSNRGITSLSFSESDFGGRAEVLCEVADEILRRGLKLTISGQLRINMKHDLALLKKLKAAGIVCNFGIDALTQHTLKLQRKGYAMQTVDENLKMCKEAGIPVHVNVVVGVPGETEQDIEDSIRFIVDRRDLIFSVFNISPFYLVHGSVYWQEPEKHNIHFLGDKDALYGKYFHGIPDRYWYSSDPYIDAAVRRKRAYRMIMTLKAAGINVSEWAENTVLRPMFEGYQSPRDMAAEIPSLVEGKPHNGEGQKSGPPIINHLHNRVVVTYTPGRWLALEEADLQRLAQAGVR